MSTLNHRKIVKSFDTFAKQVIEIVPELKSLFDLNSSNHTIVRLKGPIVREMIANVISKNPLSAVQFVKTHIIDGQLPIEVLMEDRSELHAFFRKLIRDASALEASTLEASTLEASTRERSPLIEISTSTTECQVPDCQSCQRLTIDLNDPDVSTVPLKNYVAYIPVRIEFAYIKIHFTCSIRMNNHFTANMCVYPLEDKKNTLMAIYDIAEKTIRYVNSDESDFLMIDLYEAYELFEYGYRFDNIYSLHKLFSNAIQTDETTSVFNYRIITGPSGDINRSPNLIVSTSHNPLCLNNAYIMSHQGIMGMMNQVQLPLRAWHLPESGNGYGVTMDSVTVYKGAKCIVFTTESPTFNHIIDNNCITNYTVLVELEIPKFTRFYRCADGAYLKFRFEKAVVKGFYSYPKRRITYDITVASDYDPAFKYVVGETVTPSDSFDSITNNPCTIGIHAFLDVSTAWSYFSQHSQVNILFNVKPVDISLKLWTTDDKFDTEAESGC